jgi:hypothetical protein
VAASQHLKSPGDCEERWVEAGGKNRFAWPTQATAPIRPRSQCGGSFAESNLHCVAAHSKRASINLFGKLATFGLAAFVLLQFVRPAITEKRAEAELDAPDAAKQVFDKN